SSFGFGKATQGGGQETDRLLRHKLENRMLVHVDRPGVANLRTGGQEDLVAAQRDNCCPADCLLRNVGYRVRPVHHLEMPGNVKALFQQPAGAVNLQDHQVGALLFGSIEFAVEITLQSRKNLALKANQDSMV